MILQNLSSLLDLAAWTQPPKRKDDKDDDDEPEGGAPIVVLFPKLAQQFPYPFNGGMPTAFA